MKDCGEVNKGTCNTSSLASEVFVFVQHLATSWIQYRFGSAEDHSAKEEGKWGKVCTSSSLSWLWLSQSQAVLHGTEKCVVCGHLHCRAQLEGCWGQAGVTDTWMGLTDCGRRPVWSFRRIGTRWRAVWTLRRAVFNFIVMQPRMTWFVMSSVW